MYSPPSCDAVLREHCWFGGDAYPSGHCKLSNTSNLVRKYPLRLVIPLGYDPFCIGILHFFGSISKFVPGAGILLVSAATAISS